MWKGPNSSDSWFSTVLLMKYNIMWHGLWNFWLITSHNFNDNNILYAWCMSIVFLRRFIYTFLQKLTLYIMNYTYGIIWYCSVQSTSMSDLTYLLIKQLTLTLLEYCFINTTFTFCISEPHSLWRTSVCSRTQFHNARGIHFYKLGTTNTTKMLHNGPIYYWLRYRKRRESICKCSMLYRTAWII